MVDGIVVKQSNNRNGNCVGSLRYQRSVISRCTTDRTNRAVCHLRWSRSVSLIVNDVIPHRSYGSIVTILLHFSVRISSDRCWLSVQTWSSRSNLTFCCICYRMGRFIGFIPPTRHGAAIRERFERNNRCCELSWCRWSASTHTHRLKEEAERTRMLARVMFIIWPGFTINLQCKNVSDTAKMHFSETNRQNQNDLWLDQISQRNLN